MPEDVDEEIQNIQHSIGEVDRIPSIEEFMTYVEEVNDSRFNIYKKPKKAKYQKQTSQRKKKEI